MSKGPDQKARIFLKCDARYSLELECARPSNARARSIPELWGKPHARARSILELFKKEVLELARCSNFLMLAHPY